MSSQTKNKKLQNEIVEQLKKMPIIQVACKKAGIPRSTFYRWRKANNTFAQEIEEALDEGTNMISEIAESQLINAIKEKNMTGILFWLRNRHPAYKNRLEVTSKDNNAELTDEQKQLIKQALKLAQLDNYKEKNEQKTN